MYFEYQISLRVAKCAKELAGWLAPETCVLSLTTLKSHYSQQLSTAPILLIVGTLILNSFVPV